MTSEAVQRTFLASGGVPATSVVAEGVSGEVVSVTLDRPSCLEIHAQVATCLDVL